jgi:hypothetical protein
MAQSSLHVVTLSLVLDDALNARTSDFSSAWREMPRLRRVVPLLP